MLKKSLFWLFCMMCSTNLYAETKYVVDHLIITLRSGQSTQHQILSTLPSGTKLEVLETAEKYSKVRAPDGTEGWVLNQYITKTPTAKIRLTAAEAKLAKLETENKRLKEELSTTSQKEGAVSQELGKLRQENKKQNEELTHLRRVAAKPLKLENENQRLKKQLVELENERELLSRENQVLRDSSDREWFLTGAGVIIGGIIIGLIAPSLRPRKKSSWGSSL
jgi:SH3 domain protein